MLLRQNEESLFPVVDLESVSPLSTKPKYVLKSLTFLN